jgi:hypothetical protein
VLSWGAADKVAVLVHGPGQYGEVHLPVVIDGNHPDDQQARPLAFRSSCDRLGSLVWSERIREPYDVVGILGLVSPRDRVGL